MKVAMPAAYIHNGYVKFVNTHREIRENTAAQWRWIRPLKDFGFWWTGEYFEETMNILSEAEKMFDEGKPNVFLSGTVIMIPLFDNKRSKNDIRNVSV